MWGSIWLYVATGDKTYMDNVDKLMAEKNIGGDNMFNDTGPLLGLCFDRSICKACHFIRQSQI